MLRSRSTMIRLALAAATTAVPAHAAQLVGPRGLDEVQEAATTAAPAHAAQPDAGGTAVDAVRCWRRVSRNAVFVGERFTMTVTCRFVETDAARTRPDEAALEPATLDTAPFEVLAGERLDDVPAGPYRFSQYDYTLRLITESAFGEDVDIPALELSYRIERRVGDNPVVPGRELTYILPPEPVRVLSLTPESADDIRDLPPSGFGAAQARDLRASLLGLLAALFGIAALGLVVLGAMRVLRGRAGAAAVTERRIPPALAAHRAFEELTRVRRAAAGNGWTRDTAGRALTALRIAGAVALSRPVTQSAIAAGETPREGQLRVRHGLLGRRTAALSSGLTAAAWPEPYRDGAGPPSGPAGRLAGAAAAADLHRAMTLLTTVRYGRDDGPTGPAPEPGALTRALDAGIGRVARLRWQALAPVRHANRWADAARRAWAGLTTGAAWRR